MRYSLRVWILRSLIYVVAFVPLIIFSQFISPFHFGKVVVFRSLVELMFVFYLLLIWRDRSYLPRTNPIFWAILAFAGAFSIATLTSVNVYASFWGTLERMGGLFTFWHYVVFFIVATAVMRTREDWLKLLKISIFVSVLSAIYGFGQKTDISFFVGSGGRERIFGTIGNAALFAGYEIVNVFLALMLLLRSDAPASPKTASRGGSHRERPWLIAAVAIDTLAVTMTVVRGSFLGLGSGFILLAFLYYRMHRTVIVKRIFWGLLAGLTIFIAVLVTPIKQTSFIQGSSFLSRITSTSFSSYTAKTRFWAWRIGLQGWAETPKTVLLGWGPENFNVPFSKRFDPRFFTGLGAETYFDRAHNMFVEVLVTMGLAGFLSYVSIFLVTILMLIRLVRRDPARYTRYLYGSIALLVAYAIHNSFIFDTSANFIVFFTSLGFIATLWNIDRQGDDSQLRQVPMRRANALWAMSAMVLFIAVGILIWQTNVIPAKANYTTTRGIVRGWASDFSGALIKFKESLSYNVPGVYEYRHRLAQFVLEHATKNTMTPEINDAVHYAIGEVQKNVVESHLDYLPYLYLSRLNIILGKEDAKSPYNDEALKNSMKALEISPTFIRTYYEIGQAYLNRNDYKKAIEYFQRAAELNPNVGLSYWYWGMTEIGLGNFKTGIPLVKKAVDKGGSISENDFLRLVPPLMDVGDYADLAWTYEQLTKIKPQNASYFASLAYAYARIGRIDDAVAAARQTVLIDPKYIGEAQQFVRSLGREL